MKHGDDYQVLHLGAGHIYKLPGFRDDAPQKLKTLIRKDPKVREYLNSAVAGMENVSEDEADNNDLELQAEDEEEGEETETDAKKAPWDKNKSMNIYEEIEKENDEADC